MPAGDITKEIIDAIITDLEDDAGSVIKSNEILYRKLNKYENEMINIHHVAKGKLDVTVTAGATETDLFFVPGQGEDDPAYTILKIYDVLNEEDLVCETIKLDSIQKKLITDAVDVEQTVEMLVAYGTPTGHKIDEGVDPYIPALFIPYLIELVLSDFRYLSQKSAMKFREKGVIEYDIKRLCDSQLELNQVFSDQLFINIRM